MSKSWPRVKLGDILHEIVRAEPVDPQREYQTLGVRWYGNGLFIKDQLMGHQIAASKLYRVEMGDFVYNRLFAWKGSFAVADAQCHGCHVSNEFPCFRANEERLDARFLHHYFSQESSWSAALGLSEGATPTSRNRLKQAALLSLEVPLPPIEDQRRIVVRIEEISSHIAKAERLRESTKLEQEALCRSLIANDPGTKFLAVADVVRQRATDVIVQPDQSYQFAGVYSFGRGVFKGQIKSGVEFAYPKLSRVKAGDFIYPKLMAWEGALGVVPPECDGCVVSPEFPVFEIDEDKVLPDVFDVYFRDPRTWESLQSGSTGTNARRRRLNPADFLKLHVPVPSKETQQKLRDVRRLQSQLTATQADITGGALLASVLNEVLAQPR